ncbi:MAG: transporter substrate-binding domain-containing protein [Bdellovibrio sp.]|nr:transporter substrate-binding domain-containing protein [Bdellovibrio sp.]
MVEFFQTHILPELKKKLNLDVEWVQSPLKRSLHDAEKGQIDVMFLLVKNPDRMKTFDFADEPYVTEQPGLIVRKDFNAGLDALPMSLFENKTIGQMAGSTVPDYFISHKIKSLFLSGNDLAERLSILVENRRIDGVFIHLYSVTDYIVKKNNFKNLRAVKITGVPPYPAYVVFNKSLDPAVKKEINQLLKKHRSVN